MDSEIVILTREDTLSVILPCEIDHHAAKPIREKTDKKLFETMPKLLIMDFSAVSFMDSSGIGLILGRAELCEELGARIRLKGICPSLMKLIRLSGIEKIKNLSISDLT